MAWCFLSHQKKFFDCDLHCSRHKCSSNILHVPLHFSASLTVNLESHAYSGQWVMRGSDGTVSGSSLLTLIKSQWESFVFSLERFLSLEAKNQDAIVEWWKYARSLKIQRTTTKEVNLIHIRLYGSDMWHIKYFYVKSLTCTSHLDLVHVRVYESKF